MTGAPSAGECDRLAIMHVDMDCFFAAVEALDDPLLKGRPLVVGGMGGRGVVCSASYEARAFGVSSTMPTAQARSRCPDAVFVAPRHARYRELSRQIRAVMDGFTPLIEPVSLDEAYLDVSGGRRLLGEGAAIAIALRRRIGEELQLTCSVGVGRTKLIAKLASEAAKPRVGRPGEPPSPGHGVVVVPVERELDFLRPHPVRALPGVGPASARELRRFGVSTVGDLAAVPLESLVRFFGVAQGTNLHELASGRDSRRVEPERATRSIGHEETFAVDLRERAELVRRAEAMARAVAARLSEAGLAGRTVTLKVRSGDFSTRTRSSTLRRAEHQPQLIAEVVVELAKEVSLAGGVRLLGVHLSGLVELDASRPWQLDLFGGAEPTGRAAARDAAAASVRERFGSAAISVGGDSTPTASGARDFLGALSRLAEVRDDEGPAGTGAGRSRAEQARSQPRKG